MRHHCHAVACEKSCRARHLMCKEHWKLVPDATKTEVYATVGNRSKGKINETWAPWWRAAHGAIAHVAFLTGEWTQEVAEAYLKKKRAFADKLETAA